MLLAFDVPATAKVAPLRAPALTSAPSAARASKPAGDTVKLSSQRWITVTPGKDSLQVPVTKATTFYSLARAYATDYAGDNTFGQADGKDTARFIEELKKVNGLTSDVLRPGQVLTIPTDPKRTNVNLVLAIAVQKGTDARRKAGEKVAELDFSKVKIEAGPLDSYKVSVRKKGGTDDQLFHVMDDLSGQRPDGYRVMLPGEVTFGR
ncbi:MAG TPA: LysM peptidoglycan-binding domain-containing protein [Pantanalinema sp.]